MRGGALSPVVGVGSAAPANAEGGGPDGVLFDTGEAVAANGFTGEFTDPYPTGPAPLGIGRCSEPDGRTTGAPQVAQNFADPMSSALHFAQFAMEETSMLGHSVRSHK
jgi:hypothetical protein